MKDFIEKEKKFKHWMNLFGEVLEMIMNVVVLIAIVIAMISLWKPFYEFVQNRANDEALMHFISKVFNVIIVLEFKKMLGKPDANTVLEILVFVIVRHMIIVETSALENLLTIVGVVMIFLLKKYLNDNKTQKIKEVADNKSDE